RRLARPVRADRLLVRGRSTAHAEQQRSNDRQRPLHAACLAGLNSDVECPGYELMRIHPAWAENPHRFSTSDAPQVCSTGLKASAEPFDQRVEDGRMDCPQELD